MSARMLCVENKKECQTWPAFKGLILLFVIYSQIVVYTVSNVIFLFQDYVLKLPLILPKLSYILMPLVDQIQYSLKLHLYHVFGLLHIFNI